MSTVDQVLEALREEQKRLKEDLIGVERAIAALEAAQQSHAPEFVTPQPPKREPEPDRAPEPYAGMTFYDAAAKYLKTQDGPRTAGEIADALEQGGFPVRGKNFKASVRTMLARTRHSGPFERTSDFRWRLTEEP